MSDDLSYFKRGKGRPTKFSDEIAQKIITLVRAGNYMETAAATAGITKQTLYDWLKQGANQKRGKFKDFSDAVMRAVGEAEAIDISTIGKAAQNGDWRAAAWRAERRNPKRWGRKDRIDIGPVNPKDLTEEELEALVAEAGADQSTSD
jgi:transposase-like protein